mmetsp:Transcript_78165/g.207526  ORF Transcript_78165/g.207526 Transcript_78165/m.207526 type:complete len:248 (-) Transcript_78165:326-1069(-)
MGVHLQHQQLHRVYGLLDLLRLRRDLVQPLRDQVVHGVSALQLLRDARLRLLLRRQLERLLLHLVPDRGRGLLEEDPRVGERRVERAFKQLHEHLQLPVDHSVVGLEDQLLDGLVVLNERSVPRKVHAEELLVRGSLQALHELHDRLLLLHEEPLHALADILNASLQRQVGVVVQQLHHHLSPCDGTHRDAKGLQHVLVFYLVASLRKPQEDLDLVHQPPELRPAVDLHLVRRDLHRLAVQVLDIVV